MIRESLEIKVCYGEIVRARAHHVEQRSDAVKRISNKQYTALRAKLCLPISLGVVGLDGPNTLVHKTLARQAHVHERLIELLCDVAI